MTLTEAALLITSPLGVLFYRVALILIYLIFLSFLQTSKTAGEDYFGRWTRIMITLLLGQSVLLLLSVLSWFAVIDLTPVIPTLDRFLSLATMLLVSWGILYPRRNRRADRVFAVLFLIVITATVAALIFHILNGGAPNFNRPSTDAIWSVTALFIAIASGIALAAQRPRGWIWGLIAFSLLFVGYLLHMTLGPSEAALAGSYRHRA